MSEDVSNSPAKKKKKVGSLSYQTEALTFPGPEIQTRIHQRRGFFNQEKNLNPEELHNTSTLTAADLEKQALLKTEAKLRPISSV